RLTINVERLTSSENRGQVILRHKGWPPYPCFLPDLAVFKGSFCTGPGPFPVLPSMSANDGGEGGIRTHGPVARTAVFETARFGHSRTSPRAHPPTPGPPRRTLFPWLAGTRVPVALSMQRVDRSNVSDTQYPQ